MSVSEVGFSPGKKASSVRASSNAESRKGYSGLYQFGTAYNPARFINPVGDVTRRGNYLLYWMANQALWRVDRQQAKGLDATLGYDWVFGGAFTLGPRAGIAAVKANFTPGPPPAVPGGATTTQFLGGAAAAWRITDAWSLHLDWDHTRARMNRFDGDVNVASLGVQFGF